MVMKSQPQSRKGNLSSGGEGGRQESVCSTHSTAWPRGISGGPRLSTPVPLAQDPSLHGKDDLWGLIWGHVEEEATCYHFRSGCRTLAPRTDRNRQRGLMDHQTAPRRYETLLRFRSKVPPVSCVHGGGFGKVAGSRGAIFINGLAERAVGGGRSLVGDLASSSLSGSSFQGFSTFPPLVPSASGPALWCWVFHLRDGKVGIQRQTALPRNTGRECSTRQYHCVAHTGIHSRTRTDRDHTVGLSILFWLLRGRV